jgi:hypothetical protein
MLLPNPDAAVVDERKITDYLLNAAHPDNGGKAAFFEGWGFSASNWQVMERAIRDMIAGSEVTGHISSRWGDKYVVDGRLLSPKGLTPFVRTIWIADHGSQRARLVTAYPGRQEE